MAGSGTEVPFRVVALPEIVYRVARKGMGDAYARITPEDDRNPKAGGRFDVLGGGVLYVASQPRTCYLETLAYLRPSPGIDLKAGHDDSAFLAPGQVPAQWREDRTLYTLGPREESHLVFVDLADVETRTWLYRLLADELAVFGVSHLDVPEVMHPNRAVSRALARLLYSITDEDGAPMFGGIRYASKYEGTAECWAIFERYPVAVGGQARIDREDPTFAEAAKSLGLTPF